MASRLRCLVGEKTHVEQWLRRGRLCMCPVGAWRSTVHLLESDMDSKTTCASDSTVATSEVRKGAGASALPPVLRKVVPPTTVAGTDFNVQPNGRAAICLYGTGFGNDAMVLFNYVPAPAVVRDPTVMTAEMPAELYARKGVVRVAVRNPDGKVSDALPFKVDSATAGRSDGVFIIGCPRSGTSVFSWALAEHTNFCTGPESDFLIPLFGRDRLYRAYIQAFSRSDSGWLRQHDVDFAEFAANIGLGPEALFMSRANGARWVDSTPGHTLMIPALLRLFPCASFLHIVRDGRAVVSSMMSSGFSTDWASDFAVACRTWTHYVHLGLKAIKTNPDRILNVRYENLTKRPRSELKRVFAFLGESASERSVNLIATKRINSSYGNRHAMDIRKPKDPVVGPKRPWNRWTTEEKGTFADIAGTTMLELGYEIDAAEAIQEQASP